MSTSRRIARIAGPALVALGVTEAVNIDLFAANPAPVVYLNGTILFVAGVAILQAHNLWVRRWPVLVTLAGWILLIAGLYRMAAPAAAQLASGPLTYGVLAVLFLIGVRLCFAGYVAAPRD